MRAFLRWALPVVVVVLGVVGLRWMIATRPEVETQRTERPPVLVRALTAEATTARMTVRSQGTVEPRTEIRLVSEVAGRVVEVSPSLAEGAFFEEGDVLVRIDPRDYALAVAAGEAELARAQTALELEGARGEVAAEEWSEIGSGEATRLTRREPQIAEARATLEAARASLERAQLDLERTTVRAPFTGRVRSERVDVGQYLGRAEELAVVYAIDVVEVTLPIPDADLAALDLPLNAARLSSAQGPEVVLRASFAGEPRRWTGRIVRTAGAIDPRTRMVHLVCEVEDPYGLEREDAGTPLTAGLFVQAEILGHSVPGVVALPRAAVRAESDVLVIGPDKRLARREVDVLRVEGETVYVASGLEPGERVCLSTLESAVDGMRVEVAEAREEAP